MALAGGLGSRHDVAGQSIAGDGLASAHFEPDVEGLAAHDGGIDGREEGSHRVVPGHEEEVDGAVGAGDVAVEADAETEDDFAHGRDLA